MSKKCKKCGRRLNWDFEQKDTYTNLGGDTFEI